MSDEKLPPLETAEIEAKEFTKMNRRRLLGWALLSLGGLWGLRRLAQSELDREIPWPLRRVLEATDGFWKANFNSHSRVAETAPTTEKPRLNGDIGMEAIVKNWQLKVSAPGLEEPLIFDLAQIKAMPAVTESFEFKCIEGWSRDVTCKGVRFADFLSSQEDLKSYAYAFLATLNGGYYVSMDAKSLFHPQTLLCYEMNGLELSIENGYPLRLITPVKYGVKNIKQLGSIAFTDSPPADYWAEQGYSDYNGL